MSRTASAAPDVRAEIDRVLGAYFDGLYNSDAAQLAGVFHPAAIYATATEGPLLHLTMDGYLPLVAEREAPAARGEVRRDEVVSVELAGPVTALARVHCAIGPKYFTDLLTLVRVDGRWQIIAKVFHFDIESTGSPQEP